MLMEMETTPKLNPLIVLTQLSQGFRVFNTFSYVKRKYQ